MRRSFIRVLTNRWGKQSSRLLAAQQSGMSTAETGHRVLHRRSRCGREPHSAVLNQRAAPVAGEGLLSKSEGRGRSSPKDRTRSKMPSLPGADDSDRMRYILYAT